MYLGSTVIISNPFSITLGSCPEILNYELIDVDTNTTADSSVFTIDLAFH